MKRNGHRVTKTRFNKQMQAPRNIVILTYIEDELAAYTNEDGYILGFWTTESANIFLHAIDAAHVLRPETVSWRYVCDQYAETAMKVFMPIPKERTLHPHTFPLQSNGGKN